MLAYVKTTWVDGENKYSITDQQGNIIHGFEDIKLLYKGTGGTPLSSEKMNNIEDGLAGVIAESYRTNAEQNIQIWELEAQVIQDKESMAGWQGEGFFVNQNEISLSSNITVDRGVKKDEGSASFGSPIPTALKTTLPGLAVSANFAAYGNVIKHLAVGFETAVSGEYMHIYKYEGEIYTKLTIPSTSGLGVVSGLDFSSDDTYLAVAHSVSPFVSIYKRNGDSYTKLSNPATLPPAACWCARFSQDGVYLVVGHNGAPYLTIYKRSSDTFTKLANPAVLPPNAVYALAWSPDGTYLCATGYPSSEATNYVKMYKRAVDVFTSLTFPNIFTYYTAVTGVDFSPDGNHLVLSASDAPHVAFVKRVGDTFTHLSSITIGTTALSENYPMARFSPDGKYVLACKDLYHHPSGDTFTLTSAPDLVNNYARGGSFSPDGAYIASFHGSGSSPFQVRSVAGVSLVPTTGYLTLKTITLTQTSNSVFILDKVSLASGVSRVYEVSLDNGVTFETVSTIGQTVTLGHSGNKLIVRLKYARNVSGSGTGKVYWLAVWAGAV